MAQYHLEKCLAETLSCMYLLWPGIFIVVMEWPFSEQQAMLVVDGVESLLTVSERCSYWLTCGVHNNTYSTCSVGENSEGGGDHVSQCPPVPSS